MFVKGYKQSEEHKRKLSLARKGRVVWNKGLTGFKLSEETKLKMSLANKGKHFGGVTKGKTYEEIYGEEEAKVQKLKRSIGNKGKIISEESKSKMSKSAKDRFKKFPGTFSGRKHSKSSKLKNSEYKIKYLQSHKGPFKDTKPELQVKFILELYDINYVQQYRIQNSKGGKSGLYDFYLIDYNYLIEVDGIYWHGKIGSTSKAHKKMQLQTIERDKYKNKLAKQEGYKLKRVWEGEYNKFEKWILKHLFKMELIRKGVI